MVMLPLLLLLAAAVPAPSAAARPTPTIRHRGVFISPMGEPFRPGGHDDDTLADWFRQADRNHDGRLTLQEMQQDAERFFAVLDLNHDGEIDPDEITHYESEVAPEISSGPHVDMASADRAAPEGSGRRGAGGHRRGGGNYGGGGGGFRNNGGGEFDRGAARFGLLDLPEPVASADANFNRGVSLAEFRDAAGQRFIALDVDHHGYLTLAGLEMIRPAPPPESNKPETVNEAEGESAPEN